MKKILLCMAIAFIFTGSNINILNATSKMDFISNVCAAVSDTSEIEIKGYSMNPTIKEKDLVVRDNKYYETHSVEVGDVISFKTVIPNGETKNLIKRVVATEGDTIDISAVNIRINGKSIKDCGSNGITLPNGERVSKYTLQKDEFYVLGDNRKHSLDSRDFGVVTADEIKGKIISVNGEFPRDFVE